MPYDIQVWNDYPQGGTPVSAARLNHMEAGIKSAVTTAEAGGGTGTGGSGTNAQTTANTALANAASAQASANNAITAINLLNRVITGGTGFVASSGWTLNRGSFYKLGAVVSCDLSLTWTGSDLGVPASGNLSNLVLGTLSNDYVPQLQYQGIPAGPGGAVASYFVQGNFLYLAAYAPGVAITTNTEITCAGLYLGKQPT